MAEIKTIYGYEFFVDEETKGLTALFNQGRVIGVDKDGKDKIERFTYSSAGVNRIVDPKNERLGLLMKRFVDISRMCNEVVGVCFCDYQNFSIGGWWSDAPRNLFSSERELIELIDRNKGSGIFGKEAIRIEEEAGRRFYVPRLASFEGIIAVRLPNPYVPPSREELDSALLENMVDEFLKQRKRGMIKDHF